MDLAVSLLAGRGAQGAASRAILVQRGLPLAGVLGGGLIGHAYLGVAAGAAAALLVALAALPVRGHGESMRTILRGGRGYWLAGLAINVGQLDSVVVRGAVGLVGAGIYGAGSRIGGPLNIVTTSLLTLMVPTLAVLDAAGRRRAFRRLLAPVGAYAAVLALLSPLVAGGLVLVLGEEYRDGWPVYVALVLGAAISALAQVRQAYLYAAGAAGRAGMILAACVPLGLSATFLGGHFFGLAGVGMGHVLWQLLVLAGFLLSRVPEPDEERQRDVERSAVG
jgi:O-antigen/teichoic acid export membrane protein